MQQNSTYDARVRGIPKPLITLSAWEKLQYYVELAPEEVSGLGVVEQMPGALLVTKILLPKQYGGAALTDFTGEDYAQLCYELLERGEITAEDIEKLLCWWHSHHHLGAAFSAHDDDTAQNTFHASPFLLSVVLGKGGRHACRLDIMRPFHMTVTDLTLSVVLESDPARLQQAKEELREKLSSTAPQSILGSLARLTHRATQPALEDVLTIVPLPGAQAFMPKRRGE